MNFFFFIINFQKEKGNTLTLLFILIVKSLQIAQIYYYDPHTQSAGINVQSPQSTTTPRRLTLLINHQKMLLLLNFFLICIICL